MKLVGEMPSVADSGHVPYAGKTYVATMSFKEPEKFIWHNSALANLTV